MKTILLKRGRDTMDVGECLTNYALNEYGTSCNICTTLFKTGSDPSIFISTFRESGIYLMYTPTMAYILDINVISSYYLFSKNEFNVLATFELINK